MKPSLCSRLLGALQMLQLASNGSMCKEYEIGVFLIFRRMLHLYRASGGVFLGVYLKDCHLLVLKVVGGSQTESLKPFKTIVSLSTFEGIPRIIPTFLRRHLENPHSAEHKRVVKLLLSLFSLYKFFYTRTSQLSLDTIVADSKREHFLRMTEVATWFLLHAKRLLSPYMVIDINDVPFKFLCSWKASAYQKQVLECVGSDLNIAKALLENSEKTKFGLGPGIGF